MTTAQAGRLGGQRSRRQLERLTYDRTAKAVTYRSDKSDGPTAGPETVDPLEFLARVLVHIPDKGHVTTRYYGWYATSPARHAGQGGARRGRRAARHRPRATAGADRGHPPPGGAAPADLRGRSARVPGLPRRHADRGVHHPGVGDRPDPRAPPHPCRDGGPRRGAESALDPGTVQTGRHATTRRGPSGPLSLTSTPRAHVGGTSACASDSPGRPIGPLGDRAPTGTAVRTATAARRPDLRPPPRTRRPSRGRRSRRTFAEYSTEPDRISFPALSICGDSMYRFLILGKIPGIRTSSRWRSLCRFTFGRLVLDSR